VAIVGDSITEQKLYSKFMELYLVACVPQLELSVCQFGWGGETAPGFARRMEQDLLPWQPTVVTTCFGMNDGRYQRYTHSIGQAYGDGTRRIQARCKELGARMVIGGPGAVDTFTWRRNEPAADRFYNDNLAELGRTAGHLAVSNNFVFANLHPLMARVMGKAKAAFGEEYPVCGNDGVHPGPNGHLVMAYAFLKAMRLDGEIGTITVDMAGETTATEGHRILAANDGTVEIASSRYPFCFYGSDQDPNSPRSILPFLPFNGDLNRYSLVVTNLSKRTADVTWGETTKTFSAPVLEAGINLADAFPDNPFSVPFSRMERFVADKQALETLIIKDMSRLRAQCGDDDAAAEAWHVVQRRLMERHAERVADLRAAVTPVKHTLRIVPVHSVEEGDKSQLIRNLEAGKKQTTLFYGTSLTAQGPWVRQLQDILDRTYPDQVTMINKGHKTGMSELAVANLDARVIAQRPDTVFIEFGVNDAWRSIAQPVRDGQAYLDQMLDRIQAALPACEIILMVMNPLVGEQKERRANLEAYNQMYRDVARKRQLQLIDLYPAWQKLLEEDPEKFNAYVPDGMHPNEEGCRAITTPTIVKALGLKEKERQL